MPRVTHLWAPVPIGSYLFHFSTYPRAFVPSATVCVVRGDNDDDGARTFSVLCSDDMVRHAVLVVAVNVPRRRRCALRVCTEYVTFAVQQSVAHRSRIYACLFRLYDILYDIFTFTVFLARSNSETQASRFSSSRNVF